MKRYLSISLVRLSIFIGLFLCWNPCAKAIVTNQNPFNCGVITLKRSTGLVKTGYVGNKTHEIRIYTLLTQLNLSWNSLPNNGWKVLNNNAGITQVNFTAGQIKKVMVSIPFETLAKHGNTLEPEIVQTIQITVQKTPMPPTPSDSDGDGVVNIDEDPSGTETDPNNPDSDGDGLLDGEEVELTLTHPNLADHDGDGISDGQEIIQGSNPLDIGSTQGDGFGGLGGNGSGGGGNGTPGLGIPWLQAQALNTAQTILHWNPISSSAGYEIQRRYENWDLDSEEELTPWEPLTTVGANQTTYTDNHGDDEYRYGYRIRVIGSPNWSGEILETIAPHYGVIWLTNTYQCDGVRRINEQNQVAGWIYNQNNERCAALWEKGQWQLKAPYQSGIYGLGLNDNGDMCGDYSQGNELKLTTWPGGDLTVETPHTGLARAYDIDNQNRVYGYSVWTNSIPQYDDEGNEINPKIEVKDSAVIWVGGQISDQIDDATPIVMNKSGTRVWLNTNGEYYCEGQQITDLLQLWDMNEQDDIIGVTVSGEQALWPNGSGSPIPLPVSPIEFQNTLPVAINNQGLILGSGVLWQPENGYSRLPIKEQSVLRWNYVFNDNFEDLNDKGVILSEGWPPHLLVPMELAVDANRDGEIILGNEWQPGQIIDQTTPGCPYRFWLNEDDDSANGEIIPPSQPDCNNNAIDSVRDLEDFSRLWIYLKGIANLVQGFDGLQVGLEWREITGNPAIKIYKAADEQNGSDNYLKQSGAASAQLSGQYGGALGTVGKNQPFTFDPTFWSGLSDSSPKKFLIFEATSKGKGQLVLTFKKNGQPIGYSQPIYLELLNVKEMYERGKATMQPMTAPYNYQTSNSYPNPTTSYVQDPNGYPFTSPSDEAQQCIVFVHGWNTDYDEHISTSETMFKRLWHRGYKGRFDTFYWPTLTGLVGTFNISEYRAWKCGNGLKQFVQSLPANYTKNITAHSLGNVVVGSALKQGMSINNYVMMQAALSAGCYDENPSLNFQSFLNAEQQPYKQTPDSHTQMGYRGYLNNINGNIVNFYNFNDDALELWNDNNILFKPDQFVDVGYLFQNGAVGLYQMNGAGQLLRPVIDPHESMALAARSRTLVAGRLSINGSIDNNHNLNANYQFDGNHSAQFNWNIQKLKLFYNHLLDTFDIEFNP